MKKWILKHGTVTGIILLFISILIYFANNERAGILSFIQTIAFILGLYMALREYAIEQKNVKYWNFILFGLLFSLFTSVISGISEYICFFIDDQYLIDKKRFFLTAIEEVSIYSEGQKKLVTDFMNQLNGPFIFFFSRVFNATIYGVLATFILSIGLQQRMNKLEEGKEKEQ